MDMIFAGDFELLKKGLSVPVINHVQQKSFPLAACQRRLTK